MVEEKGLIMMRILVNRFHPQLSDAFLKTLPKDLSQGVMNQHVKESDISPCFVDPYSFFKNIHYSWLIEPLQKMAEGIRAFTVCALPQSTRSYLAKYVKIPPSPPVSDFAKPYLAHYLYQHFEEKPSLPHPFLPSTPLKPLLELGRKEALNLMDFLGLYDLAEEIRHIVDQKILRRIYSCLSIKKRHFLSQCLHQKEKLVVPKLGLEQWKGDCAEFERILHRRGMMRLGKALCGQHPDFLWYFTRNIDTGRGAILYQQYSEQEIPNVTPSFILQVNNVLNYFKRSSGS